MLVPEASLAGPRTSRNNGNTPGRFLSSSPFIYWGVL
jgi:hypothetical protein